VLTRRLVCRVKPGDMLRLGDRFGLIMFGSLTDLTWLAL
jgi:phosphatidylserine decarboxylase